MKSDVNYCPGFIDTKYRTLVQLLETVRNTYTNGLEDIMEQHPNAEITEIRFDADGDMVIAYNYEDNPKHELELEIFRLKEHISTTEEWLTENKQKLEALESRL